MFRKFFIIGLVFVLCGVSALLWLTRQESKWQQLRDRCRAKYAAGSKDFLQDWLEHPGNQVPMISRHGKNKTVEEIRQEQHERFVADFDKLDSLEPRLFPVARILYGDNWQQKLGSYKKRHEMEKTFFAGSVICCSVGGALVLSSLVGTGIARLKKARHGAGLYKQPDYEETQENADDSTEESELEKNIVPEKKTLAEILNYHEYDNQEVNEPTDDAGEQPQSGDADDENVTADSSTKYLYTDSASPEPDSRDRKAHVKLVDLLGSKNKTADNSKYTDKSFFSSYKSVKQVKSDIDREAKKFKKEAKQAKRISGHQPDLLNETLTRLTKEVAAIRQYAGKQEEKVKKFQEGYDWNIIRNFALRVIRCIDNLEKRIDILTEKGQETDYLREIRDELLFALDSTGLERFEPQVNSDYRGQEKAVEAVKDRTVSDKSELKGKIADVIRCGYRFVVGEGNFRIVRAAQVRLFG